MTQELVGRSTAPTRVGRRKMHANVTRPDRPEHGIRQGVQPDIRIRVPGEAHAVRYPHPADPQMVAGDERVDIEALPNPDIPLPSGKQPLGGGEIGRRRDLEIVLRAFDDQRRQAGGLCDCGIIG
jgi:hypothetical protein